MIRHSVNPARPRDLSPFESMIYPVSAEQFFEEIWGKRIMVIEGTANDTLPIISTDEFLRVLFEAGVGTPSIRYLMPGETSIERNHDAFSRLKATWQRAPSLSELASQVEGSTLVFNQIAERIQHAHKWCQEIFKATKCASNVNAYFGSGEGASAFGPHFDSEDVFIVQTEGEKDWLLWETPELSNAMVYKNCDPPSGPPEVTVRLTVGDILYVPRRHWHWPKTVGNDHPSLHLTMQLTPLYAKDIWRWIENVLHGEGAQEKNISYTLSSAEQGSLGEGIKQAMALLQEELAKPDASSRAELFLTIRRMRQVFGDKSF